MKIRLFIFAKTVENYISIDLGYAQALDMFRLFHLFMLDKISQILKDKDCVMLNKTGSERSKSIFPYDWLDCIN